MAELFFYKEAFSVDERTRIAQVDLETTSDLPDCEPYNNVSQVWFTKDYIFPLSRDEVYMYFVDTGISTQAYYTEEVYYAFNLPGEYQPVWWWLRSGDGILYIDMISDEGYDGHGEANNRHAVRPAMWLTLS